jgi:hypothetical protein
MERTAEAKKRENDDILSVMEQKGVCVRVEEDIYGWIDRKAEDHIAGVAYDEKYNVISVDPCGWALPETAELEEGVIDQFEDTFSPNSHHHVINASPASCKCGKYEGKTLRYDGDLSQFLSFLLGGN